MRRMKNNKGITMIELITSVAILGIVGLMAAALLSVSARMYHSTIASAEIHSESQTVSRRISDMIMNADNLYIEKSDEGTILFTGMIAEEEAKTLYEGEILWLNEESNHLYYKACASIEIATDMRTLTAAAVEAELEHASDAREYLISEKVKSLTYTVFPKPEERDRVKSDGNDDAIKEKVTIGYELVFRDLNDEDYTVNSSTMPRNVIKNLYIKDGNETES